jgi:hypothetical protein
VSTILTKMLQKNQEFISLPVDKQDLILRLATQYQQDFLYIYLSTKELEEETEIPSTHWQVLLDLDITQQYIKQQLSNNIQIANRKAILALQSQAQQGNVQAAKQINEIAGILTQQDQNKIVVLHKIQRPKTTQKEETQT